jgi:hypothetical protein
MTSTGLRWNGANDSEPQLGSGFGVFSRVVVSSRRQKMRPDILVRKGVLGLALAGLMTGQAQVKGAAKDTARAEEADKDVKKNAKQAKIHRTATKPKIKSWRDEIRRGPFNYGL